MGFILPVKQTEESHAPPKILDFATKSCLEGPTMNLTSSAASFFFTGSMFSMWGLNHVRLFEAALLRTLRYRAVHGL